MAETFLLECFDGVEFSDIREMTDRIDALSVEIRNGGIQRFLLDIGDNNFHAFAAKPFADNFTDAAGTTSDYRGFVFEVFPGGATVHHSRVKFNQTASSPERAGAVFYSFLSADSASARPSKASLLAVALVSCSLALSAMLLLKYAMPK